MTLILTVANRTGIYQCSDYRLTDISTGKARSERAGGKQLSASFKDFHVELAFTGMAIANGRKTIAELTSELKAVPVESSADALITALQRRCTAIAKGKFAWLEVILTIATPSKPFRVAVISNFPRPNEPQRAKSHFSVRVHRIRKPIYIASGYLPCLERIERRRLAALARGFDLESATVTETLKEINGRAAKRSNGMVSEECWVTHQSVEAGTIRTAGVNNGQAPSTIPMLLHGFDMSAFVRDHFRAAPGKEITLVQSVGVKTSPSSQLHTTYPTGEPRTFSIGISAGTLTLPSPDGDSSIQVTIAPGHSLVPVRLNDEAVVTLTELEVKALTQPGRSTPPPRFPWPQMHLDLTIDGVSAPNGCQFPMRYYIDQSQHRFTLSLTSRGIRNIACITPDQELTLVIPASSLEFTLSSSGATQKALVELRFGWRERVDGTYG